MSLGTPHENLTARARVARALALSVAAMASLVLLGWALRIPLLKSILPGYVAMNPLTAIVLPVKFVPIVTPGPGVSLSRIVPWPTPSKIPAFTALLRLTEKIS